MQREIYEIIVSGLGEAPDRRYEATVDAIKIEMRKCVQHFRKLNSDQLDDVVQDALITVTSEQVRRVYDPDKFLSWCSIVAKNRAKKAVRPRSLDVTSDEDTVLRFPDSSPGADNAVERREMAECLEELIQEMRRHSSGCMLYKRVFEELSSQEIADAMGVPDDTVRAAISRTRKKLRSNSRLYKRFRKLKDS